MNAMKTTGSSGEQQPGCLKATKAVVELQELSKVIKDFWGDLIPVTVRCRKLGQIKLQLEMPLDLYEIQDIYLNKRSAYVVKMLKVQAQNRADASWIRGTNQTHEQAFIAWKTQVSCFSGEPSYISKNCLRDHRKSETG